MAIPTGVGEAHSGILPFPIARKTPSPKSTQEPLVSHLPLGPHQLSTTLEWENLYLVPRASLANHPPLPVAPEPTGPVFADRVSHWAEIPLETDTPWAKRALDVAICLPLLLLLSPVFFAIALLIKLQDGGPIFFRSIRIGKDGVPFVFFKFRTMIVRAETLKPALLSQNLHGQGITFKMRHDPRITPVGAFLRRWSLDELPQLWNVLIGDMSLVGPRPAVPEEVARYSPSDRERLSILPGLTCIWQISGRSEIPFDRQVEMDRDYIRNRSLWLDLYLLAMTIPAVLRGKGAY